MAPFFEKVQGIESIRTVSVRNVQYTSFGCSNMRRYIAGDCPTIGLIEYVVSTVEALQKGNRMKNTFMILWAPGPAWVSGKTVRQQPYWAQHADFMDRLFENGTVVPGGPFADATGSLVIVEVEAANEHDVADLFASDPFVVHDIFTLSSLKRWQLFLDARREG